MTGERGWGIFRHKRNGKSVGNWKVWVYAGDGRTIQRSLGTKDQILARDRAQELYGEFMLRDATGPSPTVHAAWEAYLDTDRYRRLSPATVPTYQRYGAEFVGWIGPETRIAEVTDVELRAFRDHLAQRLKPRSVNTVLSGPVSGLFQYAFYRGWVRSDSMQLVDRIPVENTPVADRRMFSEQEMDALEEVSETPYSALWALYRHTGARRGEAVMVEKRHLEDEWITLPGTKSVRAHRRVPLLPPLRKYLDDLVLPDDGPLFPLSLPTVQARLYRYGERIGVKLASFKMFRRAYITRLQALMGPEYESVGRIWVGHASVAMSDLHYRGLEKRIEGEVALRIAKRW